MAMNLRLTDDEHEGLRRQAAAEGVSMQDAARRAVREYIEHAEHREPRPGGRPEGDRRAGRAPRPPRRTVTYLDVEDLIALAVELYGDPPPIRDLGLLASAAARPQASAFGQDAYPDLWTKAAALMQSVVKNHALVDGNKRLGWVATEVFLRLNGVEPADVPVEGAEDLVVRVAAGHHDVATIATWLRELLDRAG